MAEIVPYPLELVEAQKCADLTVVQHDFAVSLKMLDAVESGQGSAVMDLACWSAAVIRYARAFGNGVLEWPKDEALASLSEGGLPFHKHVMEMRNGYLAHSVGAMECAVPIVWIRTDVDGGHEFLSVSAMLAHLGVSPDWRTDMRTLIRELLAFVDKALKLEHERLLLIAKTLGADHFVAKGIWRADVSSAKPKQPRKKVGTAVSRRDRRMKPKLKD